MLQSVTECYRVLQSVTECYRVLQSITEYNRALQYCRVLQSITKTNLAHLLGPFFGLVYIELSENMVIHVIWVFKNPNGKISWNHILNIHEKYCANSPFKGALALAPHLFRFDFHIFSSNSLIQLMSLIPGKHSQFSDIHSQHKETSSAQEVSETSVQRVLKTSAQRVLPTLFPKGINISTRR